MALALVAGLSGCSGAGRADIAMRSYSASDAHVQVMGRHLVDPDGSVRFGASGVTFGVRFRGTGLAVELEDGARDSTDHNWFTVVVDGQEPVRFRTRPGVQTYPVADGLRPGVHTLWLSKATEGQNGRNRLVSVRAAELLAPDPLPARAVEFIGDSITSGYGLDPRPVGCDDGTWYDQTHAWLAFGPRLARRLEARWVLSSVSGMGMHRNWNSLSPVMPDVYAGVYMETSAELAPWDFGRYRPDLVVVALGTNDFSAGDGEAPRPALDGEAFVRDYTRFVGTVRARYPDARLLLVNSPVFGPDERDRLAGYLREVAANRAAGDPGIETFTYAGRYASGCDGHPDLGEHVRMADELEPRVRSLMGW